MSRFKLEQLCFDLAKPANATNFKADPDSFISSYDLTNVEQHAVATGDIETLYKMGVLTQAIASLSRVFGYDNATYVRRLRNAAGLPEVKEQMEILARRGSFS
jgi:hypothetical protein